jgi:hypothetical protein
MSDGNPTRPNNDTRATEREDAQQPHQPDREPTPDEERQAENLKLDPDVAKSYEEANERGANQKGEGRID